MMVKVKVCGITNAHDALFAARAGADALGFNFVRGTDRYVAPERAMAIITELPPFVASVGVFADSPPETVRQIAELCALDYVQLHGHESPAVCKRLKGLRILKALRVRSEDDLHGIELYPVEGFVLDTYVRGKLGGTGASFDWQIARQAGRFGKVILAGGLKAENVAQAIAAARPYGVDVASGVELEPGKKSSELVETFLRIAKGVDL